MKRFAWTLGLCVVLLAGLVAALPTAAQADPAEAEAQAADEKARAREARIEEYLRKKEERRQRREAEQARKDEEAEAKRTAQYMAEGGTPAAAEQAAEPVAEKKIRKAKTRQRSALPKRLAELHEALRLTEFGRDATVAPYMDLIAAGEASAQQIAAFGNFLGQAGRNEAALAYYDLALSIDDEDPTIWINAGTLQRQIGNLGAAAGAYSEALGIDPGHAYAHYNLGAVLDEMGEYDGAIEEYKLALVLDPDLGDPALNPQAANNEKLVAVRLLLYKERAGSLGLPLVTVPNGEVVGGK